MTKKMGLSLLDSYTASFLSFRTLLGGRRVNKLAKLLK